MENKFRTTLDIDNSDKHFVNMIMIKIVLHCDCLIDLDVKPSSSKGYHIILLCNKKCDLCRFVFDDCRRFAYDLNRPDYARNILFTEKIYVHKEDVFNDTNKFM